MNHRQIWSLCLWGVVSLFISSGHALAQESPVEIGCERADETITLDSSTQLDPGCVYTGGFRISTSDIELDCQGARIEDTAGDKQHGIVITAPIDQALSNITVRNCEVVGFNTNIMVSRAGYKDLEYGHEYDDAFSNIRFESVQSLHARRDGFYLLAYVTDVTLLDVEIGHAAKVGLYLSTGTRFNHIASSYIHDNGGGNVDPNGEEFQLGPLTVYYADTGREGIALDGSRDNLFEKNVISRNEYGGLFLYKNCTEHASDGNAYPRPYGSHDNILVGNTFEDMENGVWIGSRMGQNQFFQDCGDPAYIDAPFISIVEDHAENTILEGNLFYNVRHGVRIEDDGAIIAENYFLSDHRDHRAILLGTPYRTEHLDHPVTNTAIIGNMTYIYGNSRPYSWDYGYEGLIFEDNEHGGDPAQIWRKRNPKKEPFMFTERIWFLER